MSAEQGKGAPFLPGPGGGSARALGARLTRDTAVYAAGAMAGFVLALVNVAAITRFMSPEEFGQLALLLVFASFLTVGYNMGVLQGTFTWVFGAAGEEDFEDEGDKPEARDKRAALGTGLVLTLLLTVAGTALIASIAPEIAFLLLGDSSDGNLVMLAAASGALSAIWRLGTNILRLERRPTAYLVVATARPVFVIALMIALVASGGGVEGAIAGTAIGSALALLVTLIVTHRSFLITLRAADGKQILRRGVIFVPIIASFWIAQNVDLYALSRYATDEEVGLYRLAGRIGAFLAYFSSALFMAWTPLVTTPTFAAASHEQGEEVLGGKLLGFFVTGGLLLLLAVTVTADGLVKIAPPAYAEAAPLIPLLAGGFLAHGLLVAIYRVARFPRKRTAYIAAAIASAVLFLGLAVLLIPWLGPDGAALSVIGGFLGGAAGLLWLSQRGAHPLRIDYRRIVASVALAGLCIALARGVGSLAGDFQLAVEVGALLVYPLMLALTGIVVHEERKAIAQVVRDSLPRRGASPEIEQGVRALSSEQQVALKQIVVGGRSVDELASRYGKDSADTSRELVRALRCVAGGNSTPTDDDARIGEYLFSTGPVAERDAAGRRLLSDQVIGPAELHVLEGTLQGLRKVPAGTWDEGPSDGSFR